MANKEKEPPQRKKRRLSLSLKKGNDKVKENIGSWWNFIGEEQSSLATNFVPKNTVSSTKWALLNFMEWKTSRNETFSPEVFCKWFDLYVTETRELVGSCYPRKTIYLLFNGLLRVLSVLSSVSYYQRMMTIQKEEETPARVCFPQMNVYQGPVAF